MYSFYGTVVILGCSTTETLHFSSLSHLIEIMRFSFIFLDFTHNLISIYVFLLWTIPLILAYTSQLPAWHCWCLVAIWKSDCPTSKLALSAWSLIKPVITDGGAPLLPFFLLTLCKWGREISFIEHFKLIVSNLFLIIVEFIMLY